MNEPKTITAGDTLSWTESLDDYLASAGWVLSYALILAGGPKTITATASGGDHAVSVSAATTAAWAAGTYAWQSYVTKGSERHTVATGTMQVRPNFAAATAYDSRSTAQQTLDAIEATILGKASSDQQTMIVGGIHLVKYPVGDLLALRDRYAAIVQQERRAARIAEGMGSGGQVLVRFGNA